jgi:photosystem II stability/assembly factor-like uncharacterized protein
MTRPLSVALSVLFFAAALFAADWTSSGPRGGLMFSLSASASNPRVIYAGGLAGIFRSDDNGETWRNVSGGLAYVTHLVVDPSDTETAYAISTTVYRTTDGGATWMRMNTNLQHPNRILIDPAAPKTLYVSGDCGVIFKTGSRHVGVAKSIDGGDTWQDATEGFPDAGFDGCVVGIALDPANSRHLYAKSVYSSNSSWESLDGAATWNKTTASAPVVAIVADPASPRRFGTDGQNLLASDDGGITWSVQPGDGLPASGSNTHVIDMTLDRSVPRLFSATLYGLYRSGDGGRSWLPAGDGPSVGVSSVLFNTIDSTLMIATSEGLFRAPSPAFTPWKHLDVPESGIDLITGIAVDPQRPSVVFAASRDNLQGRVFRSRDAGASWQQITGPMDSGLKLGVDASGDAWFGGGFPVTTLYRIPSGTNDFIPIRQFGQVYSIAGSPTVSGRVYVSNGSIWRTDDAGANWKMCGDAGPLAELALNPSDPNLVFAASLRGLWRSTDGCATFLPLDAGPNQPDVLHIASAPSNPAVVYRALNGPFNTFRSDDGGATWTFLPAQTALDVTKIVVDPHDANGVWMSFLNSGIQHSADGGATWKDVSDGLPEGFNKAAFVIALEPTGSVLHAGLFGAGVWELHIPPTRRRAAGPGH